MTEKLRGANRPTILRHLLPIAAVLLLVAVIVSPVAAGYADATSVSTEEALKNYLENGNSVKLQNDIDITSEIKITSTVTIYGDGHTLYKGKDNISLFNVTGGTLTLGDGTNLLTIHGNDTHYNSSNINLWALIKVSGSNAKLVMNNGVTLTNSSIAQKDVAGGDGVTGWNGAAVSVNNGATFEMNGGKITNNTARRAAVYINSTGSTFTMNGGEISNNTAFRYGGGVLINADGSFTMSGNSIIKDNSGACGGGIYVGQSMFTMDGGSIIGNRAETGDQTSDGKGGGVMLSGSTFIMNGGSITGNTAVTKQGAGGGVYVDTGSIFTMSDASITGNNAIGDKSDGNGGGVYVAGVSTFTINGASITGNNAKGNGGGVFVYDKDSTVTMAGGSITGNTATNGGAVYTNAALEFITMNGSATIDTNNEIYFHSGNTYINITGPSFTGEAKNITGKGSDVIKNGYNLIKIDAASDITASQILNRFALKSTHSNLALTSSVSNKEIVITNMPLVNESTVKIIPYNSTTANVTFSIQPHSDATGYYVNLTDSEGTVKYNHTTAAVSAGGSVDGVLVYDLTAGTTYTLNITVLKNSDEPHVYTHSKKYTAPAVINVALEDGAESKILDLYKDDEKTGTFKATVLGTGNVELKETLEWTSDKTTVITIDENGVYTLVGEGEATITAASGEVKDTLKIIVINTTPVTPNMPINEPVKNGEETTITSPSNAMTVSGNTMTVTDGSTGTEMIVTFKSVTGTPTSSEVKGVVDTALVSYKEADAESNCGVVTFKLNLTLNNVTTYLPKINATINPAIETAAEGKGLTVLAQVSADTNTTKINLNLTKGGIKIVFTVPSTVLADKEVWHFHHDGTTLLPPTIVTSGIVDNGDGTTTITIYGDAFSTHGIAVKAKTTQTDTSGSGSSTSQGSSVWLTETQTPTETPTPTEKPTDTVPTDIPVTQPTATPASPGFGILAVLAGLGAVAVLRRK